MVVNSEYEMWEKRASVPPLVETHVQPGSEWFGSDLEGTMKFSKLKDLKLNTFKIQREMVLKTLKPDGKPVSLIRLLPYNTSGSDSTRAF